MRRQIFLLLILILFLNISCKSTQEIQSDNPPNDVIATLGDEQITLQELKTNFNRNRNTEEVDSSEIRDFYSDYINYRLKLYDGYQKGYHKDSTVLAEFNAYASEIANRFWIENEIRHQRINTFKSRFNQELKAFHILKELPRNALPSDTATIYNELISVRDSLLNGSNPNEMNEKHSSRRDGRAMGGELFWITAGSTIQPFEDAVYNLEPGEVSYPVRSQFGYHLILLQERRPRTPQRFVKHIFVQRKDDGSGKQKINKAFQALKADSAWSDVLQAYTEDLSTRNRDGSLGWVGYGGRFPPELIEAAIQTNPDNAYSQPYEMSYGYQIMKVDSIRTFTSEEQKEEFILTRLKELGRFSPDQQDVFEQIAKQSDLNIHRDNFSHMITELRDSTEMISNSEVELIYFNNKTYTASDFKYWLDHISSVEDVMESGDLIRSFRNYVLEQNYIEYTRNRFPEFTKQADHFLEGLIVFKVNEEQIWNPEVIDRSKLQAFYESNRTDYKQGKTFLYTEISAASDSIMQAIHHDLLNGTDVNELVEMFNRITVYEDSTSYYQDPVYSTLETLQPGEFSEPITVNDRVFVYILNEVKPERILPFEEAFDRVLTDYQPVREENYMNELKQRYNLKQYPENLN